MRNNSVLEQPRLFTSYCGVGLCRFNTCSPGPEVERSNLSAALTAGLQERWRDLGNWKVWIMLSFSPRHWTERLWFAFSFTWKHKVCAAAAHRAYLCGLVRTSRRGGRDASRHNFCLISFSLSLFLPSFLFTLLHPISLSLSPSSLFTSRRIRDLNAEMSTNERATRALKEILQKPGNDVCADCGALGRWKKISVACSS